MSSRIRILCAVASGCCILLFSGCVDEHANRANSEQIMKMIEAQVAKEAELKAQQAVVQQQLKQAEVHLQREQASRQRAQRGADLWRSGSSLLIVVAGVMLFLGAAAGSASRKEATLP